MIKRQPLSGVRFQYVADAVLVFAQFLRRHHPTLIVKHYTTHFIGNVLCRLQHQLEVLQCIAVCRYLHKDSDTRRRHIRHIFRVEGAGFQHVRQAEKRRAAAVRA